MSSKWLTAASSPSLSSSTSWLHPLMSCDVLWLIVITVRELFDMSRLGNSSWTSAKINKWSYLPLSEIFLITSIQKIFKVFCIQNGDCVLHFKSKINCHWLFFLTKIHVTKYRRSPKDLGAGLGHTLQFVYLMFVYLFTSSECLGAGLGHTLQKLHGIGLRLGQEFLIILQTEILNYNIDII